MVWVGGFKALSAAKYGIVVVWGVGQGDKMNERGSEGMSIKRHMSKYIIRITTVLALVGVMALVAVSLLMTGGGGATAFDAGGSDTTMIHIPAQYTEQCSNGTAVPNPVRNRARYSGLMADCAALLASKDTLEGTTGDLDWSANVHINRWRGVTVENIRVSKLELDQLRLNGRIPSELGNLANLTYLDLYSNRLTGEIPSELGNLAKLERLNLESNRLTGAIPSELGNLAKLTGLEFYDNQLTGEIPSELGNLRRLGYFDLSSNQLTGEIPSELGNLANLTYLILTSNRLTGAIPSELGNLRRLEWLDLSANRLTGEIPSELGNLTNLTDLYLSGNQFTGCIPHSLSALLGSRQRQRIGLPLCAAATTATPTPTPTPRPTGTPTPTATSVPRATATPTYTATSAPRAPATPIATPTPTATSVPGGCATPVATPTSTATSVASNDVMDRLIALERQVAEIPGLRRQVAEIPELRNQVAVLATRVARLEGNSAPTPTPSATPASVVEVTPTPTATPSATPTSVVASGGDGCITALGGGGSVRGRWSSACLSANSPNSRTYYALFYTFTLAAASEVAITLASGDAAPYLFLREGEGTSGAVRGETGAANASVATMAMALGAGSYTIEASTWEAETGGGFTLELEVR